MSNKKLDTLLPSFMHRLGERQKERPDIILAAWPALIGQQFAPMARAQSFKEGILTVRVSNGGLLSLLAQYERSRLLGKLKKQFPSTQIHNIHFRIG